MSSDRVSGHRHSASSQRVNPPPRPADQSDPARAERAAARIRELKKTPQADTQAELAALNQELKTLSAAERNEVVKRLDKDGVELKNWADKAGGAEGLSHDEKKDLFTDLAAIGGEQLERVSKAFSSDGDAALLGEAIKTAATARTAVEFVQASRGRVAKDGNAALQTAHAIAGLKDKPEAVKAALQGLDNKQLQAVISASVRRNVQTSGGAAGTGTSVQPLTDLIASAATGGDASQKARVFELAASELQKIDATSGASVRVQSAEATALLSSLKGLLTSDLAGVARALKHDPATRDGSGLNVFTQEMLKANRGDELRAIAQGLPFGPDGGEGLFTHFSQQDIKSQERLTQAGTTAQESITANQAAQEKSKATGTAEDKAAAEESAQTAEKNIGLYNIRVAAAALGSNEIELRKLEDAQKAGQVVDPAKIDEAKENVKASKTADLYITMVDTEADAQVAENMANSAKDQTIAVDGAPTVDAARTQNVGGNLDAVKYAANLRTEADLAKKAANDSALSDARIKRGELNSAISDLARVEKPTPEQRQDLAGLLGEQGILSKKIAVGEQENTLLDARVKLSDLRAAGASGRELQDAGAAVEELGRGFSKGTEELKELAKFVENTNKWIALDPAVSAVFSGIADTPGAKGSPGIDDIIAANTKALQGAEAQPGPTSVGNELTAKGKQIEDINKELDANLQIRDQARKNQAVVIAVWNSVSLDLDKFQAEQLGADTGFLKAPIDAARTEVDKKIGEADSGAQRNAQVALDRENRAALQAAVTTSRTARMDAGTKLEQARRAARGGDSPSVTEAQDNYGDAQRLERVMKTRLDAANMRIGADNAQSLFLRGTDSGLQRMFSERGGKSSTAENNEHLRKAAEGEWKAADEATKTVETAEEDYLVAAGAKDNKVNAVANLDKANRELTEGRASNAPAITLNYLQRNVTLAQANLTNAEGAVRWADRSNELLEKKVELSPEATALGKLGVAAYTGGRNARPEEIATTKENYNTAKRELGYDESVKREEEARANLKDSNFKSLTLAADIKVKNAEDAVQAAQSAIDRLRFGDKAMGVGQPQFARAPTIDPTPSSGPADKHELANQLEPDLDIARSALDSAIEDRKELKEKLYPDTKGNVALSLMDVVFGTAQTLGGGALVLSGIATGWTGVGVAVAAGGAVIAADGALRLGRGAENLAGDHRTDTVQSQWLQGAGMSRNVANRADAYFAVATGMVGQSAGARLLPAALGRGRALLPPPTAQFGEQAAHTAAAARLSRSINALGFSGNSMPLSSSPGGGSWYESLAKAWGNALDKQAGVIEDISDKLANGDDKPSTMALLTASAAKMGYMAQSQNTSCGAVGQALESMARKN